VIHLSLDYRNLSRFTSLKGPLKHCPFQKIIVYLLHFMILKGPCRTLVLTGSDPFLITRWVSTRPSSSTHLMLNYSNGKGRLKYSSGDTAGAVRLFSGLLRSPNTADNIFESDKMFLEDFRAAFQVCLFQLSADHNHESKCCFRSILYQPR
jgi:hypothetical protein